MPARVGGAARNAFEVARFGGLDVGEEGSPYEVVREHRVYRLRHYFPDAGASGPAVLLVPPLMLTAEVYDVSAATSAVAILAGLGVDVWVVDFGAPEREEGGLARSLADHVLAVGDAVDRVRAESDRDVHLAGYSQGGMFCYQTAALRRAAGISSVITFGSPVDISLAVPFGLGGGLVGRGATVVAERLLSRRAVPAWVTRNGFIMLDPVKSLRQRMDFILRLHDRDALLPRERQRRFMQGEGFVAWPGPALADFMRQFVASNRMATGGFVITDRLVTLADITCPILSFVGEVDEIARPAGVRAIAGAAPRADVYETALHTGHFGLVVGSRASRTTWPTVAAWARWRDGSGELPEMVGGVAGDGETESGAAAGGGLRDDLELAGAAAVGLGRQLTAGIPRAARSTRELAREAVRQLPRLARLEQLQPGTQISLGLLLDEQAGQAPEAVCLLFDGRAHTHSDLKQRIDRVARALISVGVRHGDHVGVLMETRPLALACVAALSRIGAVAVLLRPDGDLGRELELGGVDRVVADPEHSRLAAGHAGVRTFVLGGDRAAGDLGPGATVLEGPDTDERPLPAWHRPNPGLAGELAFILFTSDGDRTRTVRITNRRWALSALGTASAAALSGSDTVYSVTPIHSPPGLLSGISGTIAGSARLAMTSAFDPATFWDEVRRYGVTVACYVWTMLHELVQAPPHPGERHHPLRLFIGSGMPRGLSQRVAERFAPARVLESYTSTEGGVMLVNLAPDKPGAMGRPLPGSAEVRIAAFDTQRGRLAQAEDGMATPCQENEVGMLLARLPNGTETTRTPLRGVFAAGDRWLSTGDLFRRDADGDYWLVDHAATLIHTAVGPVPSMPVRDALSDIPAIDLAVCYGVPAAGAEIAVAAVTLRGGDELTASELTGALARLEPHERPRVIHIVDEIGVTTWYRPRLEPLRAAGIPTPGKRAWYRPGDSGGYRLLTSAARQRLLGHAGAGTRGRTGGSHKARPAAR